MEKSTSLLTVPDEIIMHQIYFIRDHKVMLDRDLAVLYGVETKVLKQSVKRNLKRFPEDFMFAMTKDELAIWRSQFVTSKSDNIGLRHSPFCFTEQGVTMLACILNSDKAIQVNLQIIRIFTRIRKMLTDNTEIRLEIEKIKKKLDNQDKNLEIVFRYLDELIENKDLRSNERKAIGFKTQS